MEPQTIVIIGLGAVASITAQTFIHVLENECFVAEDNSSFPITEIKAYNIIDEIILYDTLIIEKEKKSPISPGFRGLISSLHSKQVTANSGYI